jgi:hypothetical protein
MKNHTRSLLILVLIAFSSWANAQVEESSYCLLRSKADPNLMPGQSSFKIHLSNEKGNITKEIIIVDNGVEKHVLPDEKGNITHITRPGKHMLTFVLGDEYYPIITDTLYSIENYQIIMEVEFKSSVLITFKEKKDPD